MDVERVIERLCVTLSGGAGAGWPTAAYLVGGPVRDRLLGRLARQSWDLDVLVDGRAADLGHALVRSYGGRLVEHPAFGTATWHLADEMGTVDLVRARRERYGHAGALPTCEPGTIEDDLRRRDFTVHAMAMPIWPVANGPLVDPLGGEADLGGKILRVLHERSFIDDPTRLLRAARYATRFDLEPDALTARLLRQAASIACWTTVSGERRLQEWTRTLREPAPAEVLRWLEKWDLLASFGLPTGSAARWSEDLRARSWPESVGAAWAALAVLAGDAHWSAVVAELSAPEGVVTRVRHAIDDAHALADALRSEPSAGNVDALLRAARPEARSFCASLFPAQRGLIDGWSAASPRSLLDGRDLVAAMVPPRRRASLLREARIAQIDEGWTNRAQALVWLADRTSR